MAIERGFDGGSGPRDQLPADMAPWVGEGIVTRSQAETIAVLVRGRGAPARAYLEEWTRRGLITTGQAQAIRQLPAVTLPPRPPASARPAVSTVAPVPSVPPERWYRDLTYVALIVMLVAVLGAAGSLLGITTDVLIAPRRLLGTDLGDLMHIGGAAACLAGATAVFRGRSGGRRLLYAGLAIDLLASAVFPGASLRDPIALFAVAVWAGLLIWTWRCQGSARRASW